MYYIVGESWPLSTQSRPPRYCCLLHAYQDLMLKNLKKRRAQLYAQGELAEAKEYNFFPVSFEMPKVQ